MEIERLKQEMNNLWNTLKIYSKNTKKDMEMSFIILRDYSKLARKIAQKKQVFGY